MMAYGQAHLGLRIFALEKQVQPPRCNLLASSVLVRGFVSVRSPLFSPPLDLSAHGGLQLRIAGEGRRFKLAVACADGVAGLTELIPGGLRWVHEFATEPEGFSQVRIGFDQLIASVRARPIEGLPLGLPLQFDAGRITRLQLLHSRFGDDGDVNPGFRPGPLHLVLEAIHAVA